MFLLWSNCLKVTVWGWRSMLGSLMMMRTICCWLPRLRRCRIELRNKKHRKINPSWLLKQRNHQKASQPSFSPSTNKYHGSTILRKFKSSNLSQEQTIFQKTTHKHKAHRRTFTTHRTIAQRMVRFRLMNSMIRKSMRVMWETVLSRCSRNWRTFKSRETKKDPSMMTCQVALCKMASTRRERSTVTRGGSTPIFQRQSRTFPSRAWPTKKNLSNQLTKKSNKVTSNVHSCSSVLKITSRHKIFH